MEAYYNAGVSYAYVLNHVLEAIKFYGFFFLFFLGVLYVISMVAPDIVGYGITHMFDNNVQLLGGSFAAL